MENETLAYCKKVEINRNPKWAELDMPYIESKVGDITFYEYKMIMNQAKDNEMAIKAILFKRESDSAYNEYMSQMFVGKKRDKYYRRSMNDIEDDIEERYY